VFYYIESIWTGGNAREGVLPFTKASIIHRTVGAVERQYGRVEIVPTTPIENFRFLFTRARYQKQKGVQDMWHVNVEELVCRNCCSLGPKGCHLSPIPVWQPDHGLSIDEHWCANGQWWHEGMGYYLYRDDFLRFNRLPIEEIYPDFIETEEYN